MHLLVHIGTDSTAELRYVKQMIQLLLVVGVVCVHISTNEGEDAKMTHRNSVKVANLTYTAVVVGHHSSTRPPDTAVEAKTKTVVAVGLAVEVGGEDIMLVLLAHHKATAPAAPPERRAFNF